MQLRSKVSSDGRIVLPRIVGKRLSVRPGDYVHFIVEARSVLFFIEIPRDANDPFASFSEWASKADEEAYADL